MREITHIKTTYPISDFKINPPLSEYTFHPIAPIYSKASAYAGVSLKEYGFFVLKIDISPFHKYKIHSYFFQRLNNI